jgi:hypothetical protein
MISYLIPNFVGPSDRESRHLALRSAITFRDGSFSERSTEVARRACRSLMREAAFRWRLITRDGR